MKAKDIPNGSFVCYDNDAKNANIKLCINDTLIHRDGSRNKHISTNLDNLEFKVLSTDQVSDSVVENLLSKLTEPERREIFMSKVNCPTPEQVKSAATKYPHSKEVLKELFPEVFEDDKYFKLHTSNNRYTEQNLVDAGFHHATLQIRYMGKYRNKGFLLGGCSYNKNIKWEMLKDELGALVLVPTKQD